jgi:hypothetical protein
MHTDLWGWQDFLKKSAAGLIPYVHFVKEYPIGGGLIYWFMGFFFPETSSSDFIFLHSIFMMIFDLLNAWLFVEIAFLISPKRALVAALLFSLNFTNMFLSEVRFEPVVVSTMLLGLYFGVRKLTVLNSNSAIIRHGNSLQTAMWALGSTMKWYPVFYWASFEYREFFRQRNVRNLLASVSIFVAVWGLVNFPFLIQDYVTNGNINNWLQPYWFHMNRPLYWDTVFGAFTIWFHYTSFEQSAATWSLALMAFFFFWRPHMSVLVKGTLICLASLLLNRIYSTQFHLWFYPMWLFFMIQLPSLKDFKKHIGLFAVFDVLNILVYPFSYSYTLGEIGSFESGIAQTKGGFWSAAFAVLIFIRALWILRVKSTN